MTARSYSAKVGIAIGLPAYLGAHRAEKVRRVHPSADPPVERAGAWLEVERGRDGDGPEELRWHPGLLLPQPLEQHVAAERDADGDDS